MTKRFATIPEVAELLGVSISTVRRMIAADCFPVHRFGRQIRIERFDLTRFIEACRAAQSGENVSIKDSGSYTQGKLW